MKRKHMLYDRQKTLDFDAPPSAEVQHIAEKTSEPPPANQEKKASPLLRPDRQIVYAEENHYRWPDANLLHDHDTITVDRIVDDIDGPAHRFVITRGDTVEAYMSHGNFHVGEVIGISHARQEVRVAWDQTLEKGGWFHVGRIYPAAEPKAERPRHGQPLSKVLAAVNHANGTGQTEADRVPVAGVNPEQVLEFLNARPGKEFTTGDLRHEFGAPYYDPEHPLDNPVHKVLRELRDAKTINVIEPSWGEPRFSALPAAAPAPALTLYTFDDFKKFHAEFSKGPVPFETYQAEFQRLWDSQDSVKAELIARFKAKELTVLAGRMRGYVRSGQTKEKSAASIVRGMLNYFVLDNSVSYSPFSGETYESALKKKVEALTAGEYYRHFEKKQEESLAKEAALADPQNLADFRLVIETKGEDGLTDEQLSRYDALRADLQRDLRAQQTATSTVQRFQADELQSLSFVRKEGYHDKRLCPLYIVQLESRVEREAFNELNRKAKQLGGWYSSFKKSDAGFQFLEKDQADRFCELLAGDVDRSDVLEARKERQELSAAESLHELATNLMERAEETIERSNDSLQNTARRADIQAGVRGQAYADQAMSRTIHSLAEALSRGEAKYLDGIRHRTQLQTLDTVLSLAKWKRIRAVKQQDKESTYGHGRRQDRIEEEPISLATVRFVEFPYPTLYRRNLEDAIARGRNTSGVKKSAETLKRYLSEKSADYVEFSREYELNALFDFVDRAKAQGIDVERIAGASENYKRLVRANITSLPELRAALREYLEHRAERRGDDPVQIAERELIGKDLPGFYPTPRPVIDRMLELADIEAQHKVLEPSCGKGDILDALKEECPDIELVAIERNWTMEDVLSAKGHAVEFSDFLEHAGSYDRIVMNPPFENGQDIDHVRHAYSLLRPGGRLVSVVCEGPFFRSDKKASEFRQWLEALDSDSEQLPADAFQGRDAFRETGVRTRLLTINKEEHA
ncbi:Methyltransferase small domain protein (plasmid) [Lacipirellula limnantheis]|uniref:Methyltransferase small domain protein n=2 Tax=Lacipirellula limnantheis TaxID=2528024 RepID=A0A517U6R4_9BACT|nr:Methyltransferase small domain protein [Lacipirellula limnantheis]